MEVRLVSVSKIDSDYLEYLMKETAGTQEFDFIKNIQDVEGLIAYIARVSSPNQKNPKYSKLIKFCIDHGHWSILEMANITMEVKTTRAIAPQILRHRSFSFQEFSQRYSAVGDGYEEFGARRQDNKNRQNSIDDLSDDIKNQWKQKQKEVWDKSYENYEWALDNGIAKETARAVLPLQTKTRLFMNGTIRSWVHYINLRADAATQKEHREIAEEAKKILVKKMPVVAEAMGWSSE
jgi:thymidylate synthase (FAD)